ncbi:unnamed protein product [Closterium sp. NIES-53]
MMEHRWSSTKTCGWMLLATTLLSAFTVAHCNFNKTFTTDVLTLNLLKNSFQSSVGALSSWKGPHPCAPGADRWRGIGCFKDLAKRSYYVANIDLKGLGLQGAIPREIGNFKSLRRLDLSNNSLSGALPLEMAKLISLKTLILNNNQFTGSIRGLIGMPNLQILSVRNNNLFGRLRNLLSKMDMLEHVDLSHNEFRGKLPRTLRLKHLKSFDVSHNNLTGNLPYGLHSSNLLETLDMSFNQFMGVIPPIWGSLKNLKKLFLNDNLLNGSLPVGIASCNSLETLELQNNALAGPIPPKFALMPNLKELYIYNNNFSGMLSGTYKAHKIQLFADGNPYLCEDFDNNGKCDPGRNPGLPTNPNLSPPVEPAQPPPSEGPVEGTPPAGEAGGAGGAGGEETAAAAQVVCSAGQTESCTCAEGQTGEMKCLDDGTGYGECVCAADLEPGTLPLDWTTRMCICLDVAKGLAYLHSLHPQLMHQGLQATCVVLDDHFHAKLADYCLPTLAANSSGGSAAARTSALTHSVNMAVAAGTAAPELAWASEMTPRVDVYAFGVLLLELITGRRPVDNARPPNEQSLVHWAKSRLSQRSLVEAMVDEKLHGSISTAALYQVAMLASQCIHSDPEARPTMAQAVEMLVKVQNLPLDSTSTRQTAAYHKGPATYNKNV